MVGVLTWSSLGDVHVPANEALSDLVWGQASMEYICINLKVYSGILSLNIIWQSIVQACGISNGIFWIPNHEVHTVPCLFLKFVLYYFLCFDTKAYVSVSTPIKRHETLRLENTKCFDVRLFVLCCWIQGFGERFP